MVDGRMNRLTLTFDDGPLEDAYRAQRRLRLSRGQFISTLLLGCGLWTGMAATTAILLPAHRSTIWWTVLGFPVLTNAGSAAVVSLLPRRFALRLIPFLTQAIPFALGFAAVVMQLRIGEPFAYVLAIGVMLYVVAMHGYMNLQFLRASIFSAILITAELTAITRTLPGAQILFHSFWLLAAQAVGMRISYIAERHRRRAFYQNRVIEVEQAKSERLLRNMLPAAIAEKLKHQPGAIADHFEAVTVLFADIVGFTPLSERMSPTDVVRLLNEVFSAFDEMAHRHVLEKIKTIGDAYMVVGGVPTPRGDHAAAVAAMALEMRDAIARVGEGRLALRIGIHTGPVVAGVIGTSKYSYDLWGDTVNTASRMESHGAPGLIHVSDACRAALGDGFELEERGVVDIKGKGPMHTWWLKKRAATGAGDAT